MSHNAKYFFRLRIFESRT